MLYNEHFCLNEVQHRWIGNACCSDMRLNKKKRSSACWSVRSNHLPTIDDLLWCT